VSADDFKTLVDDLGFDDQTPLTLGNVSAAHRRAWLARVLGLGQPQFTRLLRLTGIDPFRWGGRPQAGLIELLDRLDALALVGTTAEAVVAALWPTGVPPEGSRPDDTVLPLLRDLRSRWALVDGELRTDEPTSDDRVQALLATRYGTEAAQVFTSLLSRSTAVEVPYRQEASALPEAVVSAAGCRIAYDADRGRLSFAGPLAAAMRDALKAVPDAPQGFAVAVDALFTVSEDQRSRDTVFAQAGPAIEGSLGRYPDFEALLLGYFTSPDAPSARRNTLLRTVVTPVREARRPWWPGREPRSPWPRRC
jgi:hypothetical protein